MIIFSALSVNSPAIGDRVTKAVITSNRRRRSPQVTRQGRRQGPAAASAGNQASQLTNLVKFVQTNRLQGCLTRIICELSANPSLHGPEGVRFGSSLL